MLSKILCFTRVSGEISKSYNRYLIHSSYANLICGFESIVSSYSMLDASGVGKENIELASISLNLLGKDILGQIISVPIINKISKYGDKNPIKYIRNNVILFELSNLLECLTPLFIPSLFIPMATIGNIGKNIGFTGFASFNANIISKLSINKDNITEIYSKISIINSLSYSLGMGIGLFFVTFVTKLEYRLILLPISGIFRYIFIHKSIDNLI